MVNFRLSRKICICFVIVLIFSNSVFAVSISSSVNAQASYTRIGQFNQYITNNYGSQTADADTTLLIGMYQSLAKLAAPGVAYGIDRVNHSYYLTGNLTYLEEYLMQITENQYDIYKSEDTYLDGLSSVVTDIKTNTTNSAASDLALLQLLGDQVNIDWVNTNITSVQSVSRNFDQSNPISPSYSSIGHGSFYFLLSDLGTVARNLNSVTYRVDLPLAFSNFRNDSYGFEIAIFNSYGDDVTDKFDIVDYFLLNNDYTLSVYMVGVPFPQGYPFTIRVTTENNIIYNPTTRYIYYLKDGTVDAMNFSNFLHLSNLSTDDVVDALNDLNVNVEVNDSINVTPIDLDVSIGIQDFTAVNTISNKLRTWLTTGVSVSALIGALDALDDSFFTLSNRNTIETINNQYTDFYD